MADVNINNISVNISNISTRNEFPIKEKNKVFSLLSDYINREKHDASSPATDIGSNTDGISLEDDEFFKKHLKTFVDLSKEELAIPETSSVVGRLASSVFSSALGNSLDDIKELEEGLEGLTRYFHDLHRAIAIPELRKSGAVVGLINIMSQKDLKKTNDNKETALHIACINDHKKIALALIKEMEAEDLLLEDWLGNTALNWACINDHKEIALALIKEMEAEDLSLKREDGSTALYWVCRRGQKEIALALIEKMNVGDLSLKGEDGSTALHWACKNGHKEIALALLRKMNLENLAFFKGREETNDKAQFLINEVDLKYLVKVIELDMTVLHLACAQGHEKIALALIEKMKVEDLSLQDKEGHTALHLACGQGHEKIALALIKKMKVEDLSLQSVYKNTALHLACGQGHEKIALALIEKMKVEDLSLQNEYENTALHLACGQGHEKIALALIKKMKVEDLSLQDKEGHTALHLACGQGHEKIALALIKKMKVEDLSLQSVYKNTALHLACGQGHEKIALALIEKMKVEDLSLQNEYENTALHLACGQGHEKIALALIKKMKVEDLSLQDKEGHTALHLACGQGHEKIALALIEKMKVEDLSLQNEYENTALHLACEEGHQEIALALIEKMKVEDLSLQSKYGDTALHLACVRGHKEIALALIAKMKVEDLSRQDEYGYTALYRACINDRKEIALALLRKMNLETLAFFKGREETNDKAQFLINEVDLKYLVKVIELDMTVLHLACAQGHEKIALALIEKMKVEDLSLQDKEGHTALHLACGQGHEKIALALIKKMKVEDLSLQSVYKNTALHLACAQGHEKIALALIEKMKVEDLSLQDKEGHTALHLACGQGHEKIALALIAKMKVEDLSRQDEYGYTALYRACINDRKEIALALLRKMNLETLAFFKGREAVNDKAQVLVNELNISYISDVIENNMTPLHYACFTGNRESFIALIENSATEKDLLFLDKNERTALHYACGKGHEKIALALIAKMDAEGLSLRDKYGKSALHIACERGHKEIALALIAKIDAKGLVARDNSKNTAFSYFPRLENEIDIHNFCQEIDSSKLDEILNDLFENELHPDKDRDFFLLHPFFIVAPFYSEKHRLRMFAHFSHLNSNAALTLNKYPLMQYVAKALENNFSIEELKEQFKTIPDLMKNELLGFFTNAALKKALKEAFATEIFSKKFIVKEVNEFLSKNKMEETWSEELGNFKGILEGTKESGIKEEKAIQDLRKQWESLRNKLLEQKKRFLTFSEQAETHSLSNDEKVNLQKVIEFIEKDLGEMQTLEGELPRLEDSDYASIDSIQLVECLKGNTSQGEWNKYLQNMYAREVESGKDLIARGIDTRLIDSADEAKRGDVRAKLKAKFIEAFKNPPKSAE